MHSLNTIFSLFNVTLLILCLTTVSTLDPTSFTFREDLTHVQKTDKYWIVQFFCQAWVGQCKIEYVFLPQNWKADGWKLYVPIEDTTSIRRFMVQARISEPTGDSALKNIKIDFQNGQLVTNVQTLSVRTQLSSSTSITVSNRPINPISTSQSKDFVSKQKQEGRNKGTNSRQVHPKNAILSVNQEGDISEITEILGDIFEVDINCQQKLTQLKMIQNILISQLKNYKQDAFTRKMNSINQNEELKNLIIQKESLEKQLAIIGTKSQIESEIRSLEYQKSRKYSDFHNYARIEKIYKDKLIATIGAAGVQFEQLSELRDRVSHDQQRIQQIQQEIKKLIIEKTYVERRKQDNQKKIRTVELNGGKVDEKRVESLEAKLREYSELATFSEQAYFDAEEKLQKAKSRYQNFQMEIAQLTSQLQAVQLQIQQMQARTQSQEAKNKAAKLEAIEANLETIQSKIDTCEGANNIELKSSQPENQDVEADIDIYELRQKNRMNQPINIFNSDWILAYGVPQTFRFKCLANQNLLNGYGEILQIKNSEIKVRKLADNSEYRLRIGACSKLNGPNSFYVPRIGDVIDWQGVLESKAVYNIHRAQVYPNI